LRLPSGGNSEPCTFRPAYPTNQTALEFAQEHELAVLVNWPLNAFYRNQLIRLADTPVRCPEVHAHVNPSLASAFRAESLSRKALAILTNTKGVTCVLSGMRRPNYVDDSLGALRSPAFDVDLHLYEAFAHM
jgi:aryl-alcohol dehydrogenase-like predicted oxidoreductase